MTDQLPLRVITYLVPGLPVELFETIAQYLESCLKRSTLLIYESRFAGPQNEQLDPFKTNCADLGIIFIRCFYTFIFNSQMQFFVMACIVSIS